MSSSNVQDVGQGGQELARNSGDNLTSEEVARRLNDKLAELVRPEGLSSNTEKRNERGELINEEGLPIVEISEPVDPTDLRANISLPTPVTVEPLLPLASLPDETRAKLRAKRNQILDQLEEQERQAEIAQRRREMEELENLSRKAKGEAVKEKERLKEARELQKKMGRALLLNVSKAKEEERREQAVQRRRDEEADQDKKRSPTMKKKTVAFAESTEQIDRSETEPDSASSTDWGDVTPGRLTQRKRPTLLSQALLDKHPMKMNVVERMPFGKTAQSTSLADSDDDSEPPDSSDNEGDAPTLETDDFDFDTAQHEREIALAYYAKRNTIRKEAAQAIMVPHEVDDLAAQGLSEEPSKPLGGTVVPPSSASTIQQSIHTGKLDSDGHLLGGEEDSASEDEAEGLQEMLELIRKGEIYNVGSIKEHIPPEHHETPHCSATSSVHGVGFLPFQTSTLPAPTMRSKTSKFKASRAAAGRPSPESLSLPPIDTPMSSTSSTPISYDTRSSPKLGTPTTPTMTPTVSERARPAAAPAIGSHLPQPALAPTDQVPPESHLPMTIDSLLFPLHDAHAMRPMVIESPSYPRNPSRLVRPPTILTSNVVESRVPTMSFAVSSAVRESPAAHQPMQLHEQDKKVSRFMAGRGS